ncbi:PilN domain-containing protein [Bradyrhizobium sp. BR13661]|jgi:general secretion pathway protein L|uniref:PilN domain-containing protein n=1 Tax=Bradyrhizobium sp. BR13661 TaxID=2940622 RepID=UPI0024766B92|nr:PilN domain-containing protein [Bradyrhizobium sp. BR13661]
MIAEFKELFEEWIAVVARTINSVGGRLLSQPLVSLIEGDDDMLTARMAPVRKGPSLPDLSFRLSSGQPVPALPADWEKALRGSRVEILVKPGKVLFRPLDFPKQAADFLDGMIRAQIDRLTPWTASDAAFSWSSPSDLTNDRIQLTLAATSRTRIQPLVRFVSDMGAASVAAFAEPPPDLGTPDRFRIFEVPLQSAFGQKIDLPRILRITILCCGLAALVAQAASVYEGGALEDENQQLLRRISERRASLRLSQNAIGGSAQELLAKRKQTTPSSVMVLESMSRALPDNTYVTELRIEGDKVQVVGISQDAPSLIRLIEQSPQFSRATFFAPTTRGQNDPGERFHIEARITPYFGSGT